MPHRDTSVAIIQAINRALNFTQGHKHWLLIQPLIDLYPVPNLAIFRVGLIFTEKLVFNGS